MLFITQLLTVQLLAEFKNIPYVSSFVFAIFKLAIELPEAPLNNEIIEFFSELVDVPATFTVLSKIKVLPEKLPSSKTVSPEFIFEDIAFPSTELKY